MVDFGARRIEKKLNDISVHERVRDVEAAACGGLVRELQLRDPARRSNARVQRASAMRPDLCWNAFRAADVVRECPKPRVQPWSISHPAIRPEYPHGTGEA